MNKISLPQLWPVACHTDYVGKNSTFVAIKGAKEDGINYVPLALQKGARTIVAEYTAHISPEILQAIKDADAQLMFVANGRRSLALLSANAWHNPAHHLKIIAITGTKGKTTTAWLLHHILQESGKKSALLSSVKNKILNQEFDTHLTTAHPDYLHAFFHACTSWDIEYVVMEVAAQAVSLHRIDGLEFDGLIFTNFSATHGEFYDSPESYFQAKKELFTLCKPGSPLLINADDSHGASLLTHYTQAISYSLSDGNAQLITCNEHAGIEGVRGMIRNQNAHIKFEYQCPALCGNFNAYNITAASGMALQLGLDPQAIASHVATFAGVPGRLERYTLPNGARCFIDHAHNVLSFQAVLPLLRSLTSHLIVVAGAGGDRDRASRPTLGALMGQYADRVIITADNPRTEDPADIIAALYTGISEDKKEKVLCEIDREKAIKKAYELSGPGTIIALLGKGPEQYQIIGSTKIPFSERGIIAQL